MWGMGKSNTFKLQLLAEFACWNILFSIAFLTWGCKVCVAREFSCWMYYAKKYACLVPQWWPQFFPKYLGPWHWNLFLSPCSRSGWHCMTWSLPVHIQWTSSKILSLWKSWRMILQAFWHGGVITQLNATPIECKGDRILKACKSFGQRTHAVVNNNTPTVINNITICVV